MVQEMGIPFIDLFGAYYLSCRTGQCGRWPALRELIQSKGAQLVL
jgi:hypothetical protein